MMTAAHPSPGFFAAELRKAVTGKPWHGPGTLDVLRGISAEQAAARPVRGGHSIWEIVLHMSAWQDEVRQRLGGKPASMPEAGDWPRPPRPLAPAWRRSIEALATSLEALASAIDSLPVDRLAARVGQASRPLGTGVTIAEMLSGIVQHAAYHSGQIALLRKGLEPD
jgi:uncharacterized damage-inducible protein DinB